MKNSIVALFALLLCPLAHASNEGDCVVKNINPNGVQQSLSLLGRSLTVDNYKMKVQLEELDETDAFAAIYVGSFENMVKQSSPTTVSHKGIGIIGGDKSEFSKYAGVLLTGYDAKGAVTTRTIFVGFASGNCE